MYATAILLIGLVSAPGTETTHDQPVSVERAARQFRIQAYEMYRSDRETYDRIRSAGDRLLSNWQESGMPAEHRDTVYAWYQDAAFLDFDADLPPLPELPVVAAEAAEVIVDTDSFFPSSVPDFETSPVTPLRVGSGEVELHAAANSADEPTASQDSLSADGNPTLGEQWADSPRAILTLAEFAFGIAGF